jgi:vacuolar iron transporter family protein
MLREATVSDNAQPAYGDANQHDAVDTNPASSAGRLNWLRTGVLGANDGIVSVAGIVVGVAGATPSHGPIFTAGLAGLVAGAVSMALGEYISVSSQRDSERAQLAREKRELSRSPESELQELIGLYEAKGLSHPTASTVARELTEHDALRAHLDTELHIDPDDLANPVQSAAASRCPSPLAPSCLCSRSCCHHPPGAFRRRSSGCCSRWPSRGR